MDDKLLARVRALLAKAEGTDNEAEAEAYNKKAAELIAKYGIDQAMLAAGEPDRDKIIDRKVVLDQPFARTKAELLWAVTTPLRVKGILLKGWAWDSKRGANKRTYTMHLFGYQSDLERVDILYTSLLLQAHRGLAAVHIPYGEDKAAHRNSWLDGFAMAVRRRLYEAERRAQQDAEQQRPSSGKSVELVLADRSVLVERAADEAHPDTRNAAPRKLAGSGTYSGYQAGMRADIGTTRLGGRTAGALR